MVGAKNARKRPQTTPVPTKLGPGRITLLQMVVCRLFFIWNKYVVVENAHRDVKMCSWDFTRLEAASEYTEKDA